MCSKEFIRGAKIWRWVTYASRSRSLPVRSLWVFSSARNICYLFSPTWSLHKNHSTLGLWNTDTIPLMDVYVPPFQVGGCGLITLKYVGQMDNEAMRCHHRFSLLCTCGIIITRISSAVQHVLKSAEHTRQSWNCVYHVEQEDQDAEPFLFG